VRIAPVNDTDACAMRTTERAEAIEYTNLDLAALDLFEALEEVARHFGAELAAHRRYPMKRRRDGNGRAVGPPDFRFELTRRLRRVRGADAAFAADTTILGRPIEAFLAELAVRPHDAYPIGNSSDHVEALYWEIRDLWSEIRNPRDPLDVACERATAAPIALLGELAGDDLLTWIASVAYYLQLENGNARVQLPQERLQQARGLLSYKPVSKRLAILERAELLTDKIPAHYRSRRCNEFFFALRRHDLYDQPAGGGR